MSRDKVIKIIRRFLFVLLLGLMPATGFSQTYYVTPTGNNSANGTARSTPWRTLDYAATKVKAGDLVIITAGVHFEHSGAYTLDINVSGEPGNPITFRGEPGAILDGGGTVHTGICILAPSSYIVIENLEIRNYAVGAILGQSTKTLGGSHHVTIKGNKIHGIGGKQITCTNATYGISGIITYPYSHHYLIDSNEIYDIGRAPGGCTEHDYKHDQGLYLQGSEHISQNNIIYDCKAGWPIKIDGYCGDVPDGTPTNIIRDNTLAHFTNPANNAAIIVYTNNYSSPPCNGRTSTNLIHAHDILIENNIVHEPRNNAPFLRLYYTNTYKNTVIRNNATTATGTYYFFNTAQFGPDTGTVSESGNGVSLPTDSFFVNLGTIADHDFQLKSGFWGIDKGYANGLDHDYDGSLRPVGNGIDIGAYEYGTTVPDTKAPTLLFLDDVAQASNGMDTISASWGDATVKKWDYNATGACSSTAGDYSKTDADDMNQSSTANNGKWICLYGEDAAENKATLASSYPINVTQNNPLVYVGPDAGYGAKVDVDAAGAQWLF